VLPVGVFVDVGDGVIGLVPFKEVHGRPAAGPPEVFQTGEQISVVVSDIERPHRRVFLARPEAAPSAGGPPIT
jgi:small subunit ribosomal protein S1